ncbi:unnamed protein product [Urochloa humidicola]
MVSSSHCRHKKRHPSAFESQMARDWTALPQDILFTIFVKLEPHEVTRGADRVCTAWRWVAVGDPVLWRHLDMGMVALSRWRWRAAVRRGAGRCESFTARCCSNESLKFLVKGAPALKSLRLLDANTTYEALNEAIQKLSSLEELELTELRTRFVYKELIQLICEACPNLKRLRVTVHRSHKDWIYHRGKCVIPVMSELRSLELNIYDFTVKESMAMVDNCPPIGISPR